MVIDSSQKLKFWKHLLTVRNRKYFKERTAGIVGGRMDA